MTNTNSITVQKTRIIGTRLDVYSAWEPYAGHSTLTHVDGVRYGRIGTAPLPAALEALPAMSDERSRAVRAWHADEYRRAYVAIESAHPETRGASRDMGEIEVSA